MQKEREIRPRTAAAAAATTSSVPCSISALWTFISLQSWWKCCCCCELQLEGETPFSRLHSVSSLLALSVWMCLYTSYSGWWPQSNALVFFILVTSLVYLYTHTHTHSHTAARIAAQRVDVVQTPRHRIKTSPTHFLLHIRRRRSKKSLKRTKSFIVGRPTLG